MGLSPDVRYRVCLMASTDGSVGGLLDEGLDRARKRVVRVMDEHVPCAQHPKDVGRTIRASAPALGG